VVDPPEWYEESDDYDLYVQWPEQLDVRDIRGTVHSYNMLNNQWRDTPVYYEIEEDGVGNFAGSYSLMYALPAGAYVEAASVDDTALHLPHLVLPRVMLTEPRLPDS
jgi:hypothetical protein